MSPQQAEQWAVSSPESFVLLLCPVMCSDDPHLSGCWRQPLPGHPQGLLPPNLGSLCLSALTLHQAAQRHGMGLLLHHLSLGIQSRAQGSQGGCSTMISFGAWPGQAWGWEISNK